MSTNRLEASSDGVIAIIITIMVLELKVPHTVGLADLSSCQKGRIKSVATLCPSMDQAPSTSTISFSVRQWSIHTRWSIWRSVAAICASS